MASYKELLKQRESLEKQIAEARQKEIADAIGHIQRLIQEHGLTAQDIFPAGKARRSAPTAKVAAKYKNPLTGETWTGRGKAPRWIDGKDRAQFLIA